jgi:hypothetical protein
MTAVRTPRKSLPVARISLRAVQVPVRAAELLARPSRGTASTISEIEAFHAISRLLRFAQFASDNSAKLTR